MLVSFPSIAPLLSKSSSGSKKTFIWLVTVVICVTFLSGIGLSSTGARFLFTTRTFQVWFVVANSSSVTTTVYVYSPCECQSMVLL